MRSITQSHLIYHRGRHGVDGLKENSRTATEFAIHEGAEWVEFDVQEDLKIAHDPGAPENTLRLMEALRFIRGRCGVVIDLKDPYMLHRTSVIIDWAVRHFNFSRKQIIFSSFHHPSVLKSVAYGDALGAVIMDCVPDRSYVGWLAGKGVSNLHISFQNALMDSVSGNEMRRAAREYSLQVWVYTVNTLKDANFVLNEYGADKVFTDRPDLLLSG